MSAVWRLGPGSGAVTVKALGGSRETGSVGHPPGSAAAVIAPVPGIVIGGCDRPHGGPRRRAMPTARPLLRSVDAGAGALRRLKRRALSWDAEGQHLVVRGGKPDRVIERAAGAIIDA